MTTRFMSTTAPSTATSSDCARSSRRWTTISTRSKRSMAWAIDIGKPKVSRARMSAPSETLSRGSTRPSLASLRHAVSFPAGKPRSALTRRIIFFNAVALLFLIGGVLFGETSRVGLVDERLSGIQQQARIIASTLAEYTANEQTHTVNLDQAEPLLRQLVSPTRLRARIYGVNGKLEIDTRNLLARNIVQMTELPPIDFWSRFKGAANRDRKSTRLNSSHV